jgi:hypothetical protein
MSKKVLRSWVFSVLVILLLLPLSRVGAKEPVLVGQETANFSLPSSQDRLINYANEYYGKYHLIITFFPAAFTPT